MTTQDTIEFAPGQRPDDDGPPLAAPAPDEVPPVTSTGRPRTPSTPGRKPGQRNGTGKRKAVPPSGKTAAPPRAAAGPPRPRKATGTDYRAGIMGVFQLIAAPLAIAGRRRRELAADAAALMVHGEGIADALNETARADARVARVLDKVLSAGPYGLVLAAVIPLGAQLAVNHGVIPVEVGERVGAVNPAKLVGDDEHQGDGLRPAA